MDVALCVSDKNVAGNVLLPKTSCREAFLCPGVFCFISKCSVTSLRNENDKNPTRQL